MRMGTACDVGNRSHSDHWFCAGLRRSRMDFTPATPSGKRSTRLSALDLNGTAIFRCPLTDPALGVQRSKGLRKAAKSLPSKSDQLRQYRDPEHVPQPNHGDRGKASRQ
jgi:hypothetical protein